MSNLSLNYCRAFILFLGLLLITCYANGQGRVPLRRVYHIEKPDGSVLIVAENHHSMPFTTLICAELVKMHSSIKLPLRINVLPGDKPYLLAVFTPETTNGYSYRYTSQSQDGIYTGHLPDTSYVYRLPYQTIPDTILPQKVPITGRVWGSTLNLYRIRLSENTPICAARAGTIIAIKQQVKNSRHTNTNLVFVQHDDGSYACYENIRKHSVIGLPGRRVAPGDTLAYFGGNRLNHFFWFAVQYPTDSVTTSVPVVFRMDKRLVRPH